MCVCLLQRMQEYKLDKLCPSVKPLPGKRTLGCQQGPWVPRSMEANSVPPPVLSGAEPPRSYSLISHQENRLHMLGNWISLMWNTQYTFPLRCSSVTVKTSGDYFTNLLLLLLNTTRLLPPGEYTFLVISIHSPLSSVGQGSSLNVPPPYRRAGEKSRT